MAAKSPTTSVKSREMIGGDQFSQRREVFDKHDTMFVPLPSPTAVLPVYKDVEPIVTSNHGKTTSNFKRNTAGYSSMRESRNEDRNHYDFRPRKYSDNFTSELNQSDDVEYRHTMTDRTRRLSKLRREFLNSNLHEPNGSTFTRTGVRASMPTNSTSPIKYKIESPNLYKFPFAEPYTTPTPVRRVIVDLGPADEDSLSEGKENKDPEDKSKYQSLPNEASPTKIDHHKLFEELIKRYSPQRKTVDWTLPATRPRPRVVGSVPKSTSSAADSLDTKASKEKLDNPEIDEVFENKDNETEKPSKTEVIAEVTPKVEILQNGPENIKTEDDASETDAKANDSKASLIEAEADDHVPELFTIQRQISKESSPTSKKPPLETITDLSIPEMIKKMTEEGECLEIQKNDVKKVKRKRSFLDKLLGRNKGTKK